MPNIINRYLDRARVFAGPRRDSWRLDQITEATRELRDRVEAAHGRASTEFRARRRVRRNRPNYDGPRCRLK
jgi:hypothetical protein